MRILLVDDHDLFRQGLKWLLSGLSENLDLDEADSLAALASIAAQDDKGFDLVLLDLTLPDSDGLESLQRANEMLPDTTIVVLSGHDEPHFIGAVIDHGAAGFIPKASSREILIAALQLILAGGVYIPSRALSSGLAGTGATSVLDTNDPAQQQDESMIHLTERQRDVLKLAVKGKVNKVIARELGISEATVKAHLSASFRALGVNNRTEATFKVAELGWTI